MNSASAAAAAAAAGDDDDDHDDDDDDDDEAGVMWCDDVDMIRPASRPCSVHPHPTTCLHQHTHTHTHITPTPLHTTGVHTLHSTNSNRVSETGHCPSDTSPSDISPSHSGRARLTFPLAHGEGV